MHGKKPHLVQIRQLYVSTGCLLGQALYLYGCLAKGVFVAAFFKEWRVRFHTRPEALSVAAMVLTCTLGPPASK